MSSLSLLLLTDVLASTGSEPLSAVAASARHSIDALVASSRSVMCRKVVRPSRLPTGFLWRKPAIRTSRSDIASNCAFTRELRAAVGVATTSLTLFTAVQVCGAARACELARQL